MLLTLILLNEQSGSIQKDPHELLQSWKNVCMNETSWSWKQYVQRTHKIGVNLNDFEAKLTARSRSQRNLNYTQSFTENKNDSRHTWQTINEVTSRPTSGPFKSHNNWMEKCTTSQSRRAWWIWKVRNILEAFFHKRCLFFHTW